VTPVPGGVLAVPPPDARALAAVPSAEELAAWAQLDRPPAAPVALVVLAGRPDPAELAAVVVLGLLAAATGRSDGAGRPGGRGQRASWPAPAFTGARSWSVVPVAAHPRGTDAPPA
jgi:hypothetical protein